MHWPRWCNRRRSWGFRSGGGGDGDGDAVPEVRGASGGLVGGVQGEASADQAAHPFSDLQFGVRPGAVVAGPGAGAVVVEVPGSRPVVELAVGDADDGQVRKGHAVAPPKSRVGAATQVAHARLTAPEPGNRSTNSSSACKPAHSNSQ